MWLALAIIAGLLIAIYLSVADRNLATPSIEGRDLVVTMRGLNRVWAMKARVAIPLSSITDVRVLDARPLRRGLRLPGTSILGLIFAGSYLKGGEWSFFAVRSGETAVVIDTEGTRYRRVMFETAGPYDAVHLIDDARKQLTPGSSSPPAIS